MAKKSQIQKFREAAHAVGAHDSEKRFNAALKTVAKAPPPAKESKPEPKKPTTRV
jgi:hypothetical protein